MKKKNLPKNDDRGFLARLTIALAPQDELIAHRSREITKGHKNSGEKAEEKTHARNSAARFLGFV